MPEASPIAGPPRQGWWPAGYDLAELNFAGWLLVLSSAVVLFLGLLAVGYLTYTPKLISSVQWAACAAVFVLSLSWFRLCEAAMGRCGITIHREKSEREGVRNVDEFA
jgi:hypothetical protein